MDETTPKGLYLVAGILLSILIITFGIITYNKTRPMQKQADNNLNTVNQALATEKYSIYDERIVPGSIVVSAINTKASPSLVIHVTTNSSSKNYTSASYNVSDVSDPNYIEENGGFRATLNKNSNTSVVGITFVQVSSGYYAPDNPDGDDETDPDDTGLDPEDDTGTGVDLTNLIPSNIRRGVNINGVIGTLDVNVIGSDIDLTNLIPENIRKGITINNVTGTLEVGNLGSQYYASGSPNTAPFTVSNLDFTPTFIYVQVRYGTSRRYNVYNADSDLYKKQFTCTVNDKSTSNSSIPGGDITDISSTGFSFTFSVPPTGTNVRVDWIAVK